MKKVSFNDIVEVKYFYKNRPIRNKEYKRQNRIPYIYGIIFILFLFIYYAWTVIGTDVFFL